MMQFILGFMPAQAIRAVAELEIADKLADGPKSATELARLSGGDAESIHRVLRALASIGVFAERDGKYQLTPLADHLRRDSAESVWPAAMYMNNEIYQVAQHLSASVRTGEGNFSRVLGMSMFDYLAAHPERGAIFDRMMASFHGPETAAIVEAYDFSAIRALVDVGGGNGDVLRAILEASPNTRGVLFDLAGVAERAQAALAGDPVLGRMSFRSGDFFKDVARGGDAYILRHIIHDWNDDESVQILQCCRAAMDGGAKLLVMEEVIPDGNVPSAAKWLDVAFLAMWSGKERTRADYDALYRRSGFKLTRVIPTSSPLSIIEGVPA
jgi:hypothetical protein